MRVNILAETEDDAWQQYYKNMGAPWKLETHPRRKLQALCQWREHTARRRDKPRGWVAKDTELVVLAENSPESVMELQKLDSLSASLVRRDGAKLVEILRAASEEVAGKGSEIISLDIAKKPLTAASRNILKKCQAIVALKAAQLKIAPELLARKKQLVALINSRGESEVNFWPQELEGWRRALLETQIAEVLNVIE